MNASNVKIRIINGLFGPCDASMKQCFRIFDVNCSQVLKNLVISGHTLNLTRSQVTGVKPK